MPCMVSQSNHTLRSNRLMFGWFDISIAPLNDLNGLNFLNDLNSH